MLKHGILGLLNYHEMTGYEIMEVFRDSLNYFWSAQTSQIYRELQTLKKSGYVTDTAEPGRGGEKKKFSITEAGREELVNWLRNTPPASPNLSLLMLTFFRGELPVSENIAFFEELKKQAEEAARMMDTTNSNAAKYSGLTGMYDKAIYWQMTVEYGKMLSRMHSEWAEKCIEMLSRLPGGDENEK